MGNDPQYLPTPQEIRHRAKTLLWMQNQGWDDEFIVSVMVYDHPEISVVEKMTNEFGAEDAYRKLKEFFE